VLTSVRKFASTCDNVVKFRVFEFQKFQAKKGTQFLITAQKCEACF
jgi:hypothetical protein